MVVMVMAVMGGLTLIGKICAEDDTRTVLVLRTAGGALDPDLRYATFAQGAKADHPRGQSSAMVSGATTVLTASVTANSIILLTEKLAAGIRPMGSLAVDSQTAGYGFSITSSSDADTAVVNWTILEP